MTEYTITLTHDQRDKILIDELRDLQDTAKNDRSKHPDDIANSEAVQIAVNIILRYVGASA